MPQNKARSLALLVQVLDNVQWPAEMPWTAEDFQRYDESSDANFYIQPRFVTHIDDGAIGALTECAVSLHRYQRLLTALPPA